MLSFTRSQAHPSENINIVIVRIRAVLVRGKEAAGALQLPQREIRRLVVVIRVAPATVKGVGVEGGSVDVAAEIGETEVVEVAVAAVVVICRARLGPMVPLTQNRPRLQLEERRRRRARSLRTADCMTVLKSTLSGRKLDWHGLRQVKDWAERLSKCVLNIRGRKTGEERSARGVWLLRGLH